MAGIVPYPVLRARVLHSGLLPGTVVHCYGHGGAGVTLAWGCAEEVVSLVGPSLR